MITVDMIVTTGKYCINLIVVLIVSATETPLLATPV